MMACVCRAPSATPPSAASCASRCRSASSMTTRARRSSTPTRRSRPRSPTVQGVWADRLGLRRRRRVQEPALPEARLRRRVGGRAAVGPADPRARARRALRTRPTPAPTCSGATARRRVVRPRRHDHHQDRRAAALGVGGRDPRPSPRLHQLAGVPGQRAAPGRQQQPQRPAPAARGRSALPGDLALWSVRRIDDARFTAARAATTSAATRAPTTSTRPAAVGQGERSSTS